MLCEDGHRITLVVVGVGVAIVMAVVVTVVIVAVVTVVMVVAMTLAVMIVSIVGVVVVMPIVVVTVVVVRVVPVVVEIDSEGGFGGRPTGLMRSCTFFASSSSPLRHLASSKHLASSLPSSQGRSPLSCQG